MKTSIACSIFILQCLVGTAQKDPSSSTIAFYQSIPAFQITTVPDSNIYSSALLQKNKPVVIILFNPDCEHCQRETKELLAWRNEIKELQIVMVSAAPYHKVKTFYEDYNIAVLPNIKMGCDIEYKLVLTFKATSYPAVYVYDAKGILSKAFVGGASVPAIIQAANQGL